MTYYRKNYKDLRYEKIDLSGLITREEINAIAREVD
jgi:hypothetical protein